MRAKPLSLLAAAVTITAAGVLGIPLAAQAAVPPPVGGSCVIHLSISGAHTIYAQTTNCHYFPDDPGAAYMSISYHFSVTGQPEQVVEKTCTATAGLSSCLKKYTFTGPSPAGKQTYRMSAYASWFGPTGQRTTAQASTAVVD